MSTLECSVQAKQTDNNRNDIHYHLCIVADPVSPCKEEYSSKTECYDIVGIHVTDRIQDVSCYNENYPYPLNDVICFIHQWIISPKPFIVNLWKNR